MYHGRHGGVFDHEVDVGAKAHVQHAIGLIEDEELDAGKIEDAAIDQILEAAGRGNQNVAAALHLGYLVLDVGAAVDDHRSGNKQSHTSINEAPECLSKSHRVSLKWFVFPAFFLIFYDRNA